jgi:hypothetical protein
VPPREFVRELDGCFYRVRAFKDSEALAIARGYQATHSNSSHECEISDVVPVEAGSLSARMNWPAGLKSAALAAFCFAIFYAALWGALRLLRWTARGFLDGPLDRSRMGSVGTAVTRPPPTK